MTETWLKHDQIKSNHVYLKSFFVKIQTLAKGYSPDQIKSNHVYLKSFFVKIQTLAKGYSPDLKGENQQFYNNNRHSSIYTCIF